MKITKIGHCCLVIEESGKKIMTDPGMWSDEQNEIKGIDIVLITHEHSDHFHLESLQAVLANNPQAIVVTNSRVSDLLAENNIESVLLEHEQREIFAEVEIAGFGTEHAVIYSAIPNVMNTGFLIQNRFFYPGDALTQPGVPIEILAMPIIGPWMTLAQALDWTKAIKPDICIPVHDGMLKAQEWLYRVPAHVFTESGIQFKAVELGEKIDYS